MSERDGERGPFWACGCKHFKQMCVQQQVVLEHLPTPSKLKRESPDDKFCGMILGWTCIASAGAMIAKNLKIEIVITITPVNFCSGEKGLKEFFGRNSHDIRKIMARQTAQQVS